MPIIHMTFDPSGVPAGAQNLKQYEGGGGPKDLWTYETHHGLCIGEREDNRYDDSDFYMIVLNPDTDKFEEIMFASTRGWTYPCMGSHRDASPELMERYRAEQQAKLDRIREAGERRSREKREAEVQASGLTHEQAERLLRSHEGERLLRFLGKKVRSDFKKSLQQRVREWAADPKPTYSSPLSRRQMAFVG